MTPEKVKNESGYLSFSDNEFKSNLVVFLFNSCKDTFSDFTKNPSSFQVILKVKKEPHQKGAEATLKVDVNTTPITSTEPKVQPPKLVDVANAKAVIVKTAASVLRVKTNLVSEAVELRNKLAFTEFAPGKILRARESRLKLRTWPIVQKEFLQVPLFLQPQLDVNKLVLRLHQLPKSSLKQLQRKEEEVGLANPFPSYLQPLM